MKLRFAKQHSQSRYVAYGDVYTYVIQRFHPRDSWQLAIYVTDATDPNVQRDYHEVLRLAKDVAQVFEDLGEDFEAKRERPSKSRYYVALNQVYKADAEAWTPQYSPWRHGGWYVHNVRYPNGAIGCVSRNFADRKWRIVAETNVVDLSTVRTFPNRDAAARAELELAQQAAKAGA